MAGEIKPAEFIYIFHVPWPTLNEWQGWHWGKQGRWKDAIREAAHRACHLANLKPPDPVDYQRTFLTLLRIGANPLDNDNLIGGAKGVVDSMTARVFKFQKKPIFRKDGLPERIWGLYSDDRAKFIDVEYLQLATKDDSKHGIYLKARWEALPEEARKTVSRR